MFDSCGSDVTRGSMLRQKELVQQAVHLQESFAVQQHLIAFDVQKSPVLQSPQRFGETFLRIHAKFVFEIRQAQMAELELQNELANEPLVVVRSQRPVNRQFTGVQAAD